MKGLVTKSLHYYLHHPITQPSEGKPQKPDDVKLNAGSIGDCCAYLSDNVAQASTMFNNRKFIKFLETPQIAIEIITKHTSTHLIDTFRAQWGEPSINGKINYSLLSFINQKVVHNKNDSLDQLQRQYAIITETC